MNALRIRGGSGLTLETKNSRLVFDTKPLGNSIQFISHAHLDHVYNLSMKDVVMSEETASILKAVHRRGEWTKLKYKEKFRIGDCLEISMEPAGHVLGSTQYIIDVNGLRTVYTGDFNIYDSLIHQGAKPVESDILIIESTYGIPYYRFPAREKTYADIVRWVLKTISSNEIPAFKVYSLGKSQEIIRVINTYLDIPVVVSKPVSKISDKYNEHGIPLEYVPIDKVEGLEVLKQGECVYVSSYRENVPTNKKVRWAVATGWALRYRHSNYDISFPLSGHSDYYGLVKYILESRPKQVYTIYGYAKEFSTNLRRIGINAKPVYEASQSTLD
ncbi:MAG: MBL fold metallo-hydrolase [Nitrososphaerota archaeon]